MTAFGEEYKKEAFLKTEGRVSSPMLAKPGKRETDAMYQQFSLPALDLTPIP